MFLSFPNHYGVGGAGGEESVSTFPITCTKASKEKRVPQRDPECYMTFLLQRGTSTLASVGPQSSESATITSLKPPAPTYTDTANGFLKALSHLKVPTPSQLSVTGPPSASARSLATLPWSLHSHTSHSTRTQQLLRDCLNGQNLDVSLCYPFSVPSPMSISKLLVLLLLHVQSHNEIV